MQTPTLTLANMHKHNAAQMLAGPRPYAEHSADANTGKGGARLALALPLAVARLPAAKPPEHGDRQREQQTETYPYRRRYL